MMQSHQSLGVSVGSVLYIEDIEDEGACLSRINFFVSRELKILGITEIMIGIVQMVFGLPLNFTESYVFAVLIGIPWWTGIWYIISGSLVVDIINTSNTHLKQVIFLMHAISVVAALIGVAAYFVSLYMMPPLSTNFFLRGPLILIFFLMTLCFLEFIIAAIVLFLHCTLLVHEHNVTGSNRRFTSHH
ncbi:membrane-spanning 4-domains subfamily A member 18-like isoform X1 [Carcharodon carcharias]|uniref:membrane-spanning 4-domains subfamily A member 18-like isoform X1 n=1 Tax=Carcharodon carcharias TaxID=13397 RepID=UPI001B7EABF8|nr:membrane-spanning 4-domains subfamily A member 18-like isoform X1 [Carcharodon carcharias]